ncbi:MAG TPA: Rdx family protein [Myxococcota bacterium]
MSAPTSSPPDGPPRAPTVEIEYCPRCRWLARAAWLAQELLTTFERELGAVALVPSPTPGAFEVRLAGETIFSRRAAGRHADATELKRLVRDRVAPGRDLGHADRAAGRP